MKEWSSNTSTVTLKGQSIPGSGTQIGAKDPSLTIARGSSGNSDFGNFITEQKYLKRSYREADVIKLHSPVTSTHIRIRTEVVKIYKEV